MSSTLMGLRPALEARDESQRAVMLQPDNRQPDRRFVFLSIDGHGQKENPEANKEKSFRV